MVLQPDRLMDVDEQLHVVVLCWGGTGDAAPVAVWARTLREQGFAVTICAHVTAEYVHVLARASLGLSPLCEHRR